MDFQTLRVCDGTFFPPAEIFRAAAALRLSIPGEEAGLL
jgi:hypothetical protein